MATGNNDMRGRSAGNVVRIATRTGPYPNQATVGNVPFEQNMNIDPATTPVSAYTATQAHTRRA